MGNTITAQNNNVKSYSCVAATPVDQTRLEMSRQQRLQATQKKAVTWADEDDDDSDEECECQEEVYQDYVPPANNTPCYARATSDDDDW